MKGSFETFFSLHQAVKLRKELMELETEALALGLISDDTSHQDEECRRQEAEDGNGGVGMVIEDDQEEDWCHSTVAASRWAHVELRSISITDLFPHSICFFLPYILTSSLTSSILNIAKSASVEVEIYKIKILREKVRKHACDQEKK